MRPGAHKYALVAALACASCGRLGFDARGDGPATGDGAPADTPPLPAQVCAVHQIQIPPGHVPVHADLAATATGDTVTVLWADADAAPGQRPQWGTRIGTTTFAATVAPMQLEGVAGANEMAGIRDLGDSIVIETVASGVVTIEQVSASLTSPTTVLTGSDFVAGRDAFTRSNTMGTWVSMYGLGALHWQPMGSDGALGPDGAYAPSGSGTIASFACDDGPDHVHVGFRAIAPNGTASCTIGSVYYSSPSMLYMGGTYPLPGECTDVRVAASADATDNLFGFYQSSDGSLGAAWVANDGTLAPPIPASTAGRAPRTRYDGTVYRLAWLDSTTGTDELRIGEYPPGGALTQTPLPGWPVAGDNAFTLLRQGNLVWLVILSPTELSLLQLCS